MRILLVNDHCHELGGKEKYLVALRPLLEEAGHLVGTIYAVPVDQAPSLREDMVRFWVPGLQTFHGTRRTIARLKEIGDLFRPDVVHIHHNPVNTLAVAWMMHRWPVMRSVHDAEFLCPVRYYMRRRDNQPCNIGLGLGCFRAGCLTWRDKSSWSRLLKSQLARRVHLKGARMGVQSRFMQDGLTRLGFDPRQSRVLPYFVAIPDEIHEPEPLFLYVGRLNRIKGPQVVIEAMRQVSEPAMLEIIGAGELRDELEALVERLGLCSRVRFTGYLEGDALGQRYREALAAIVPTLMPENCSLVIQEAFSHGKPVIATNMGGSPEMVCDGISGFLVAHNDPTAIADRMNLLLRDRERARRMGLEGRRFLSGDLYRRDFHLQALITEYQAAIARGQIFA